MKDWPEEQLTIAGVRGPIKLEDALFVGKKSNRISPLQVVRADRVMGTDHVRTAALHARRALAEERNQADSLDVEFLRYLAGKRQIKHALELMGLPAVADAAVVVGMGHKHHDAVAHFVDSLGLREDDAVLRPDPAALHHFVGRDALEATDPSLHLDLVLEKVAEVDMLK